MYHFAMLTTLEQLVETVLDIGHWTFYKMFSELSVSH